MMPGTLIIVTDINGRIIWQSPANASNTDNIIWYTGNTPDGVYFYRLQDANGMIQSGRLVIVK